MIDPNDGGKKSRKMVMAYVVMALGSAGYVLTARWPLLGAAYAEYCMFLLGSSGIYASGNAAVKWMAARKGIAVPEPTQTPPAPKAKASTEGTVKAQSAAEESEG